MTGAAPRDHRALAEDHIRYAAQVDPASPEAQVYLLAAGVHLLAALHDLLLLLVEPGEFPQ